MQIGILFISLALLAILYSFWNYYSVIKEQILTGDNHYADPGRIRAARIGFYTMTALVSVASFYLMHLILTHQFQVAYVYRFSSRDLSFGYLISAFWAGQEGSFLLWAFFVAIMGIIFIKFAREFESHAMLVINLVQASFLIILIKASPFELLPQIPADGAGLNPLLQNPWMVIHPPVLFAGYAAAAFPFAIAIAALARKEYREFISQALPWTLFTSLTLGAGIIIGGYWAYKVLGWGGYWGWDPVENSSLVPWLTTMALFHGLIVQKTKNALPKTNLSLATVSFALVLYATFLTRSGVLADFSVHSFQDLGINSYLVVFILLVLSAGLGMLLHRYRQIQFASINFSTLNRENILLGSMAVFAISAILTILGTSSPILTDLIGNPAQVETSFYNKIHLPIGIAMGLLLGLAPFLRWRDSATGHLYKNIAVPLILAIASAMLAIASGISGPAHIFLAGSAAFAFWSNGIIVIRRLRFNRKNIAAPLAHVGVACLLAGIVVSSTLGQSRKVVLTQDTPTSVYGQYQMIYRGMTAVPNGKDMMNIEVNNGNTSYVANPRFYFSEFNKSVMAEPEVKSGLTSDLYISPLERRPSGVQEANSQTLLIKKGGKKRFGDYEIYFKDFELTNHSEGGAFRVGALLEITAQSEKYVVTPALLYEQNQQKSEPAVFPVVEDGREKTGKVALNRLDADQKAVELSFEGISSQTTSAPISPEQIVIEVSRKPFMSILWLGTILITLGTLLAIKQRFPKTATVIDQTTERNDVREENLYQLSN